MAAPIPNTQSAPTIPMGNITRVVGIDLSNQDYTEENGFFFRVTGDGNIRYCPIGNEDGAAITKAVTASTIFVDPEICRKIFKTGTTATGIFVGFGV